MTNLYVYKYPLDTSGPTAKLDLPGGAQLLHVDVQANRMMLWALVDPEQPTEERSVVVLGTGHPVWVLDRELRHINTFLVDGGAFVFHAFEAVSS